MSIDMRLCALLALAAAPAGADTFNLGPIEAAAGTRASGMLAVPAGSDAGTAIPVTVLNGAAPGPVLALIAGTHGYEYAPIVALQRVRATISPAELRGTVILVHVANPESFYGRTIYTNPVDGKNLNRVYPGDAGGTQSERIAHLLTSRVIERSDYVIDLHAGDGNEALRPYVYMPVTGDDRLDAGARLLALAFGIDHIVVDRGPLRDPGDSLYTDQTALTRGVPAITTETGQLGSTDERWVDQAVAGLRNVLVALGMMPGEAGPPGTVVWLSDYRVIESPATGLFRPEVREGYFVADGGRLGVLVDAFGDELAVVRAPFAGVVNYVIATPPVREGEPLAMLSRVSRDPAP